MPSSGHGGEDMERIKVINARAYDIGLMLPNGTERVAHAGSYTLLTRDELDHLVSVAPSLFIGEKQLRLEDRKLAVELGFAKSEDAPVFGEAEIRKQLAQKPQALKAWLDGIQEPYLLDEVFRVAQGMDLPATKLQIIQERFPGRPLVSAETE